MAARSTCRGSSCRGWRRPRPQSGRRCRRGPGVTLHRAPRGRRRTDFHLGSWTLLQRLLQRATNHGGQAIDRGLELGLGQVAERQPHACWRRRRRRGTAGPGRRPRRPRWRPGACASVSSSSGSVEPGEKAAGRLGPVRPRRACGASAPPTAPPSATRTARGPPGGGARSRRRGRTPRPAAARGRPRTGRCSAWRPPARATTSRGPDGPAEPHAGEEALGERARLQHDVGRRATTATAATSPSKGSSR